MSESWLEDLCALRPCADALAFAAGYDSLAAAWAACERGDWMLWLLGKLSSAPESNDRKRLVLCACACARTALPYVRAGDDRLLRCIETTERWARGEATIDEVREARRASYAAADAASAVAAAAAAWDAAYAAAYAAAAWDAAAAAASDAAYAAAYAATAWNAAFDTARTKALKDCADLVRQHYPIEPTLGGRR